MSEYDYKEEANKLKEQRNLIFDPIRSKYSNIYKLEKMLSEIYSNNLETYSALVIQNPALIPAIPKIFDIERIIVRFLKL